MKKMIFFLIVFGLFIKGWAIELKGPVLVFGSDDPGEGKEYYKVHDIFNVKDVLIHGDEIYVLEQGTTYVHRFDLKGNFKGKIGGMGAGPSEFYEPRSMEFVGENLWVLDYRNGRIQEFRDFKYIRPIKLEKISLPASIAVSGEHVFITGTSIYPWAGLSVFDHSGNLKKTIKLGSKYLPTTEINLWYMMELKMLHDGRLMVGYINLPTVILIDKNLEKIRSVDLSDYYSKYEQRVPGGNSVPSGYAITSFCSGPDNTVLISVCNNEPKICNRIIQFSSDLSKKIGEFTNEFHIWEMDYYPDKNWMVFLTRDEVLIYEVR